MCCNLQCHAKGWRCKSMTDIVGPNDPRAVRKTVSAKLSPPASGLSPTRMHFEVRVPAKLIDADEHAAMPLPP